MKITLIIPTLKRNQELFKLLETLSDQSFKNFDLIIIDQNNSPTLSDINYKAQYNLDVEVISVLNRLNASAARNLGAKHAKGEIISFPDDDCWYQPGTLKKVHDLFESQSADVITGIGSDMEGKSNSNFLSGSGFVNVWKAPKAGIEYSIFVKKEVFESVSGFDEHISPGSAGIYQAGEALDFMFRILNANYKVYFDDSLVIYHPYFDYVSVVNSQMLKRIFGYSAGFGYDFKKNKLTLFFLYYVLRSVAALLIAILRFNKNSIAIQWVSLKGRLFGFIYS